MPPDLTEDDKTIIVNLIRETIERDRSDANLGATLLSAANRPLSDSIGSSKARANPDGFCP
jgi:hypothetical protein